MCAICKGQMQVYNWPSDNEPLRKCEAVEGYGSNTLYKQRLKYSAMLGQGDLQTFTEVSEEPSAFIFHDKKSKKPRTFQLLGL